jgi:DNA helicase II / ATP-dependent DNA helicase PcrA
MIVHKDFDTEYSRLNDEQKQAVDTIDGAVLVIAGPGSGKTQLLSLRVANILKQTDTLASSILCLTFTESAANNMRERLTSITGRDAHKVAIHTFHSLGSEIINQNPEYFFFGAGYEPSDELAQFQILRSIFQNLKWDNPLNSYHVDLEYTYLRDAQATIKALKNGGLTPEDFAIVLDQNEQFIAQVNPLLQDFFETKIDFAKTLELPNLIQNIENIELKTEYSSAIQNFPSLKDLVLRELKLTLLNIQQIEENRKKTTPLTEWKKTFMSFDNQKNLVFKDQKNLNKQRALQQIYAEYQSSLHKQRLYDFEDMLLEVVKVLENKDKPDLKYNLQEKYQYILVDEFQDTNGVQIGLIDNLIDLETTAGNPNILAVGDDDQAVFKFQGASIQNILKFQQKYPRVKIVTLNKNYRSSQEILDLSMQVIEQSHERLAKLEGVNKDLVSMV